MDEKLKIAGGVAVITGAASGIGAGLARHAASLGMKLVLADWNAELLQRTADDLNAECQTVQTDVRDYACVKQLRDTAFDRFGAVDLLFNNAGILDSGLSWEIDRESWQRSIDVNLIGAINVIRSFIPPMIKSDRPAQIINTGSVGGFFPTPLMAPYSATKFAITALTESVAHELASVDSKIRVSLLAPGAVKTALMNDEAPEESAEFINALRNMADAKGLSPDEFAPLVFAAIERGEYWITPQPQSLDDRLAERTRMILARQHPVGKN